MLSIFLVLVALVAHWAWHRRICKPTDPPMLPEPWPFFGLIPTLIGNSCNLWDAIEGISNKCHEIGGVGVTSILGLRTLYIITDPDDCFTVMNTCTEKDPLYDLIKPWLGNGLITSKASIWKKHRKLLNPAFSQVVLDTFMDVFNGQARKLVTDLEQVAGTGSFDHWDYAKHSTLESVCLTTLGVDLRDSPLLTSNYLKAGEEFFIMLAKRFHRFWLHSSHIFRWSNIKKKQDEQLRIIHNLSETVLQRKKSELNRNINSEQNNNVTGANLKVLIDLLLELSVERSVLSEREVREHVDTVIAAAYETTASTLMFTMLLLGSHPEVQQKAYAEVLEVLGSSDRDVEKQDLAQLVYLEAVLKESLRLYTVAPIVTRWIDRNIKLKNCMLTAGRTCVLFLFSTHRHPMWGPDAHEFRPERWLDPATLPHNSSAFSAFGLGRRTCIGKAYAFMTMKTTLAHVLRRYRIISNHKQLVLKYKIMLKPAAGYHISIETRA